MTACVEPGCPGRYEDGYCNVCGMPERAASSPSPAEPVAEARPGRSVIPGVDAGGTEGAGAGEPDVRAGGDAGAPGAGAGAGSDAGGGDGSPASGAGAGTGPPAGSTAASGPDAVVRTGGPGAGAVLNSPESATPQPTPDAARAAGRPRAAGSPVRAAAARRRTAERRRTRRSRLGMGLTSVPPVPSVDPTTAVMVDPEVPEERRNCPNCGAPVGRAAGGADGRTEGFCPQCRAPYSFTPKLQPGDLVAGQYEVAGALAHGGLGWIYLARDRNVSDRWVVLKGLLNTGDQDALSAAIAEQQFLAQVKHPLIVEIYNVVTHEGAGYTVMEYVGGTSLKQLLKDRRERAGHYDPLPVDHALAYVLEVLPAFTHLHEQGLLYCDFKPDNLIHEGDGIKLIDLGGVRRADDLDSPIYGTVGYQAPEVPVVGPSVASDIYTIGRTLAVLTFEFRGYQGQYQHSLPPVSEVEPFLEHDSFYRLVAKACAPDPDDRFVTVEELRAQMVGVLRQVVQSRQAVAATVSAHSNHFESPVVTGDTLGWWELPALKPDEHDPMLDWVSSVRERDPMARHTALRRAPEASPEVLLEQARAALQAGRPELVREAATAMLREDPWDWRAAWVLGLEALARGDGSAATESFGAVRDQLPGEIAPRLALALAAETEGVSGRAESEYLRCWRTDASYVAPAAFGLARVRDARDDVTGAIAALETVPSTSRAHPTARWLRSDLLRRRGELRDLRESLDGIGGLTLDPRERAWFTAGVYEQALRRIGQQGPLPDLRVGGVPAVEADLRKALEVQYRTLADYTPDPDQRASLVDRANAVRPWSFT